MSRKITVFRSFYCGWDKGTNSKGKYMPVYIGLVSSNCTR